MIHYRAMRKTAALLLAILFVLLAPAPSARCAAEIEPAGSPYRKIQRGFLNIALSPFEMSHHLAEMKKYDETALPSWTLGIVNGWVGMINRILVGSYEIVTAPIPLPRDYAPVMQPEFTWEYLQEPAKEK